MWVLAKIVGGAIDIINLIYMLESKLYVVTYTYLKYLNQHLILPLGMCILTEYFLYLILQPHPYLFYIFKNMCSYKF